MGKKETMHLVNICTHQSSIQHHQSLQILNKPIASDGTGFLGLKEILDQQDEAKKDEIMREMERRHKEKMDLVRNI